MHREEWRTIEEFPNYEISDLGEIYNSRARQTMRISYTTHGHAKITLTDEHGNRHTRSVAMLVADAFIEQPNVLCDQLIVLDGDFRNLVASNLAWRPRWFAWLYTRQIKVLQPHHFHNLPVRNMNTGVKYKSIVEAGIAEGLLFADIWRSTNERVRIFPNGHQFEVIKRV